MSRCIRCAGNNTKRIIKHLTFQLTTTPLRGFSFVFFFLFPYFLVSYLGLILQLSSPTHSLHLLCRPRPVPSDQTVLRPLRTTSNFPRQSLKPLPSNTTFTRQYACPQLRSHAFEQDVLGSPRSPGHLHDHRHRYHIQLCPDDRHHWCRAAKGVCRHTQCGKFIQSSIIVQH
jgi:hypothetical protein